jgi:hypothetical protein
MKPGLLLFSLAIACNAFSQAKKSVEFIPQLTSGIGVSLQQFNGLNDRIKKYPVYRPLDGYALTLELGTLNQYKRFMSDMNLLGGSSFSGHSGRGSVVRYLAVNIGWGYDLVQEKNILIYPMVGLEGEIFQARFFRDNSSVPFDNLVQDPTVQNDLTSLDFVNRFFSYRLGVGFSLSSERHRSGTIGLRAFYTGSFVKQPWKSRQGQKLADVPYDHLSQFHFALIIGMQEESRSMGH